MAMMHAMEMIGIRMKWRHVGRKGNTMYVLVIVAIIHKILGSIVEMAIFIPVYIPACSRCQFLHTP